MYVAVLNPIHGDQYHCLNFLQSVEILFVDGRPKVSELSNTLYKVFATLFSFLTIHFEDARFLMVRSFSSYFTRGYLSRLISNLKRRVIFRAAFSGALHHVSL